MKTENLAKLIEETESDYKRFKGQFDRLNTLISAMQYGLNLIEDEFEGIPVAEETTYEPYNHGYMKSLKSEIESLTSDKERYSRWYKEEEEKLNIYKSQLKAVA